MKKTIFDLSATLNLVDLVSIKGGKDAPPPPPTPIIYHPQCDHA